MKCLKNRKTSNIVRVSDQQAQQMVGSQWTYTSKEEWKSAVRPRKVEEAVPTVVEETVSEKQLKHKKSK